MKDKLFFAKVNSNAIIPSKREEDAGFDIYACFDEDEVFIEPNEIKIIPTGIASAFSNDYVLIAKERGSSGSKGMSVRMGVIDSGYRNEILIGINNTSDKTIVIAKNIENTKKKILNNIGIFCKDIVEGSYIFYPHDKAIAQLILLPVPKVDVEEIPYNDLLKIKSERGLGKLGSTNK